MGTKRLSDVLTADDIINVENNKICIFSGVGSGKNWFIENELIKKGNILYITSRRAKVNEILEEKIAQEYITWDNIDNDIVTTTNYGIQKLVMNEKFGSRLSEIIKHFSFIVVDEAHSLASDATYADSAFHLQKFLKYINRKYKNIKIILMTGTPEPLQYIPKFIERCHVFDKRMECINVVPKRIFFVKNKEMAIKIMASIPKDQKTIYYTNSAKGIVSGKYALYDNLVKFGIAENEIAICMSEKNITKNKTYLPSLPEICKTTKDSITQERTLPKSCRYLLTTSTLKEGVNIEDSSIKIAFCETHLLSDIQQFAGRVRTSLDTLYIIQESEQHVIYSSLFHAYMLEAMYSYKHEVATANLFLKQTIKNPESTLYSMLGYDAGELEWSEFMEDEFSLYSYGGEAVKLFVNQIEKKNQYIKFDHLCGEFSYFKQRMLEQKRVNKLLMSSQWKTDLEEFCQKHGINYTAPIEEEIDVDIISEYLSTQLDKKLIDDERKILKDKLASFFWLSSSNPQIKTLNNCLKQHNLSFELQTGNTTVEGKNKRYLCVKQID